MNSTKIAAAIIQAIRRHPDQDRAQAVIMDVIHCISTGEDLEVIEAMYAEDLAIMRGAVTAWERKH